MSESESKSKSAAPDRPLNVAIVGAGVGGQTILRMVRENALGRFPMRILGVADTDPNAPGLRQAREMGVGMVTTDYREIFDLPGLELIIELTGRDEVRDDIERTRPRHVRLVDHFAVQLFVQLSEAEDAVSRKRTEMRAREEDLQRTREYLENIVDNAPVMIITADLEGRIVAFNRSAEETLRYRTEEVVGRPASCLYLDPNERDVLIRRLARDDEVRDHETTLLRKDGTEVPVAITLAHLRNAAGVPIGTAGISRDISHRTALMDQIIQSERLAAVGRLAAGVAHEINNPLAAINEIAGYLHDLHTTCVGADDANLTEELKVGLPKILVQVERCRSITHRLLRFSRKSEVTLNVADVNESLDEVLTFLDGEAKMAGIEIHRQFQPDLPQVIIEEIQLEEILINLLKNAIQALSPRGHGAIWLVTEHQGTNVSVTVRDDGPGIAEQVRDRLFDPFVTTKKPGQGTGLGLSICYGIVKQNGGEIRVQSEPGEGATFQVILPVHRPAKREAVGP